jgi:Cys-tRNA(Pro)/Cys-tRNA(Cys) deacylase
MKKEYKTFIDKSSLELEHMVVSAGKIGVQIVIDPKMLVNLTRAETPDVRK